MSRHLVSSESLALPRVEIRGKEAHYIARVLRTRIGERILLFDGAGLEADAVVVRLTGKSVLVDVVARRSVRDENPLELTVVQAALTGDKTAWLVEKLTEIGVSRVVFFTGEQSVRSQVAIPRLARIAEAAARQSGRNTVPRIEAVESLGAAIDEARLGLSNALRVFGEVDKTPDARTISDVVDRRETAGSDGRTQFFAVVAIGPESGFTKAERELLCAHQFDGVRVGPRTLRAESAGIVFASILMHRLGDYR